MAPEALEVVERVDVVEGVAVVGLREGERAVAVGAAADPVEVEEALHDGRDGDVAVGAHVTQQEVPELLAERVRHLRCQHAFIFIALLWVD